jgi:type IV pilus biogenesis protein CpaD/CtpE
VAAVTSANDRRAVRCGALALVAVGIAASVVGCASSPASPAAATPTGGAAAAYLAIAEEFNKQLDHEFDGLADAERGDLSSAKTDLRQIAATERAFDQRLAALSLPSGADATARALITANEARAALTTRAAASGTLDQLNGYKTRLTAANAQVERPVKVIRAELGLPAPDTS